MKTRFIHYSTWILFFYIICGLFGSGSGNLGKKHPNKCMCLILKYNSTINCTTEETVRELESESEALDWDLWPVSCWHSCRQITGSSCRPCLPRASFIKWHVCHTFIFIRSAENQRWETARGSGRRELLPLSHSLFVPAIAWGPITFSSDRSPPPLLSTALPRSPALQLQKHLPLNMQSSCQGIKETYTYKCIGRRKANIYWH